MKNSKIFQCKNQWKFDFSIFRFFEIFRDFRDFSRFRRKIFDPKFQNRFSIKKFQLFSLIFFVKPFKISCRFRISQFPVAWRPGGHCFLGIGGNCQTYSFFALSWFFWGLGSVNLHYTAVQERRRRDFFKTRCILCDFTTSGGAFAMAKGPKIFSPAFGGRGVFGRPWHP